MRKLARIIAFKSDLFECVKRRENGQITNLTHAAIIQTFFLLMCVRVSSADEGAKQCVSERDIFA